MKKIIFWLSLCFLMLVVSARQLMPSGVGSVPVTGDHSNLLLWGGVSLGAIVVLVLLLLTGKKKK